MMYRSTKFPATTVYVEFCCGTCCFAAPAMKLGSLYLGIDINSRVVLEANRLCDAILESLKKEWITRSRYKRWVAEAVRLENVVPRKKPVPANKELIDQEAEEGEASDEEDQENDDNFIGHGRTETLAQNDDSLETNDDETDGDYEKSDNDSNKSDNENSDVEDGSDRIIEENSKDDLNEDDELVETDNDDVTFGMFNRLNGNYFEIIYILL